MKKNHQIIIVLLLLNIFTNALVAQKISMDTKSSKAHILASIVVTCEASETYRLDFGKVVREVSHGRIEVSPTGMRIIEGDLSMINYNFSPAKYSFSGGEGEFSKVAIPNTSVVLTNTDKTKKMIVSDWRAEIKNNTAGNDIEVKEVCLGATLNVEDENEIPSDYYSGTYNITFLYD
jgi:Domain of unknown function (DUF4402)